MILDWMKQFNMNGDDRCQNKLFKNCERKRQPSVISNIISKRIYFDILSVTRLSILIFCKIINKKNQYS